MRIINFLKKLLKRNKKIEESKPEIYPESQVQPQIEPSTLSDIDISELNQNDFNYLKKLTYDHRNVTMEDTDFLINRETESFRYSNYPHQKHKQRIKRR